MDIHKSKLAIAKWHYFNVGRTCNCFIFSISPNNISCENFLLERTFNFELEHKINHFSHTFWKLIDKLFFTIKRPRSSRSFLCVTSFFLERILHSNFFWDWPSNYLFFLQDVFLLFVSLDCSFLLQIFLQHIIYIHMFLKRSYSIFFTIKNNCFLACVLGFVAIIGFLWQNIQCMICAFSRLIVALAFYIINLNHKDVFPWSFQILFWACNFLRLILKL